MKPILVFILNWLGAGLVGMVIALTLLGFFS